MKKITLFNLFFCLALATLAISCSQSTEPVIREDFLTEDETPKEEIPEEETSEGIKSPLFRNSIVSTEIDFVKSTDPDAFIAVIYKGQEEKEMPSKESDVLIDRNTFVFEATFTNNKKVGIWCHSDFTTQEAAKEYVDKLTDKLGKLPEFMRDKLSHVVVHKGNSTAFAEDQGRFFVLYSNNMDTRISNNDLEETVFHESVHVALDLEYAGTDAWKKAQESDGVFITEYAESRPIREDFAESAIFVYTMVKYPGRLSEEVEDWVKTHIPNRYQILKQIFQEQ